MAFTINQLRVILQQKEAEAAYRQARAVQAEEEVGHLKWTIEYLEEHQEDVAESSYDRKIVAAAWKENFYNESRLRKAEEIDP